MVQRHWFAIILCLGILLSLIPVSVFANPTPRTRSIQLFLEKDGRPYNESVIFSMECYGYFASLTDHHKFLYNKSENDPNPPMEVFSLSGNCPSYGCFLPLSTRSPPDIYWEPESSELCKLNGTTTGQSFVIWNISDITGIECFKRSDQWDVEKKVGRISHYYKFTSDYYSCKKRLETLGEQCQEYLVNSNQEQQESTITDNQCVHLYNHQALLCDSNLQEINISSINPAEYICKFRFDIPPDYQTSDNQGSPNESRYIPRSPIESLYCSLLSIFGARC